jgi:hypothetical protein
MIKRVIFVTLAVSMAMGWTVAARGAEDNAEGIAFFEKKIRPVLVEQCYACHHAPDFASSYKAGLLVDSMEGLLKGGDSGKAAIVPGEPEKSELIRAIRYGQTGKAAKRNMPPKWGKDHAKGGKLPDEVIADFEKWVKMGAPVSADFKTPKQN